MATCTHISSVVASARERGELYVKEATRVVDRSRPVASCCACGGLCACGRPNGDDGSGGDGGSGGDEGSGETGSDEGSSKDHDRFRYDRR